MGYVAKGVVYLLVGGTGLFVAVGLTERARGSSDVIRLLAGLPMGRLLIGALTVGLVGYSVLSFVAALRAPEAERGWRGAVARVADAVVGLVYAGLAALAVRLLADGLADAAAASELWAARLLALPAGRPLLGAAGLAVVGVGGYLAWRSGARPLSGDLERRRVSKGVVRVIVRLARVGLAARAVLFVLCGGLLVRAAWTGEPRRVNGLGDALDTLADAPAGPFVVGVVAAGCVAYGGYQFAKARWRRVRLEPEPTPGPR
ncbi:DUF1206 domain-containing protein [Roseisolibacter sp. H3M3-2]|uniref:DUF1206 domain-containing protein n=1 Tax=Roseisolibacter sp. H3M3-2 TaxID=3031323 RepID=UPI0023DBD5B4|nr:DUF1206 domain-containing protein [Roseisolibacter sp. H3M3-2]MDF1505705.1 DUF1206 domain-containing protein [Roseisolibacter sp. H3M3-2]